MLTSFTLRVLRGRRGAVHAGERALGQAGAAGELAGEPAGAPGRGHRRSVARPDRRGGLRLASIAREPDSGAAAIPGRGQGKSVATAGPEAAMGASALGVFAEAAFSTYCAVLA